MDFRPDWVSSPGETIFEILEERSYSLADFSARMNQTLQETGDLLEGRSTITIGVARRLEEVLGASVEFWMSRDFQYREDSIRLHPNEEAWVSQLPLGDMINYGWIRPIPNPSEETSACLRFFGVPNVSAWKTKYDRVQELVNFRTSASFDSNPAAVAAWLRQGEIETEGMRCGQWSREGFEESLSRLRALTKKKQPEEFVPALQRICAENGVAVAIVRAPTGCRASGATRFLSPENALLMLSFRYLSDDHFWFSFFHEAAHLILHGERLFLEGDGTPSTAHEVEANVYAARVLVPEQFQSAMLKLPVDSRAVIRFAHKIGISPGIVVGQLQHHGILGYRQLSSLRRRYTWE
jgi:HTH-type transcriptional regulator / antitoxin HigA